ncbi:MAG: hypothetical protein H6844_11050 [Alphaproteobacteria bacterium]|nr:hypothetical protein [Alphaproteobacteria bacterium]
MLIEVKRASDTRIRREVIGQILDYAANGVAYWPKGALKAAFVRTCEEESGKDPDMALSEFFGTEDPTDFWDQAEANLEAGRVKLVVAADSIPSELARVIEFLNEQMRAEVRAVELRYFLGEDGRRTLAPRIFGETEKTRPPNPPPAGPNSIQFSVEAWLEKFTNARRLPMPIPAILDIIARIGGETVVTSTQGSLAARFQGKDGKLIHPLISGTMGRSRSTLLGLVIAPNSQMTMCANIFSIGLTKLSGPFDEKPEGFFRVPGCQPRGWRNSGIL